MFGGIPIADLTAPTLVGITVAMILLGWLVPKSTLKSKENEAIRWQKAYEAECEARRVSDAQTVELLELSKATYHILDAMFSAPDIPPGKGGAHRVVPTSK